MALAQFSLFHGLSQDVLELLERGCTGQTFARSVLLFDIGDPVDGLYMVQSGCVKLYAMSKDGREHILSVHGAGESLAEWSVFLEAHTVSARSLETSRILMVNKNALLGGLRADGPLAMRLMGAMASHADHAVNTIVDLTLRSARERLCHHLEMLVDASRPGAQTVTLKTSHANLASMLGLTAETLSRSLRQLSIEGVVSLAGRRRIVIKDLARLKAT
ncbi:MAG TPA: Crp/Fnr family transcriptional regulator [Candidatus Xenobia bacterium]|jgi:CRP/FNR family transcriptional regulator